MSKLKSDLNCTYIYFKFDKLFKNFDKKIKLKTLKKLTKP